MHTTHNRVSPLSQDDFKLAVILRKFPMCWDYRQEPRCRSAFLSLCLSYKFIIYYFILYVCMFSLYVGLCTCKPGAHRGQRRGSEPPELEFQMAGSHHEGTVLGN